MADLPILDAEFSEHLLRYFGSGRERLAIALAGKQPVAAGIFQQMALGVGAYERPCVQIISRDAG